MKNELIHYFILIITAFFPQEEQGGFAGYCPCEFINCEIKNGKYYVQHHSQGVFSCEKETYETLGLINDRLSCFQKDQFLDPQHTIKLKKRKYSWANKFLGGNIIYIDPDKDSPRSKYSCWNSGIPRNLNNAPLWVPQNILPKINPFFFGF